VLLVFRSRFGTDADVRFVGLRYPTERSVPRVRDLKLPRLEADYSGSVHRAAVSACPKQRCARSTGEAVPTRQETRLHRRGGADHAVPPSLWARRRSGRRR
ncbi:unnamed protein product, partial [Ectocarpus sp. 12 AP-2014]